MTDQEDNGRPIGPATTCHVDRHGVIVRTNSHFDHGHPQQFIGLRLADFIEEPSRTEYLQLLQRVIEQGEVNSFRNTVRSLSGERSYWDVRISPWRDGGRIIGAIMVGHQQLV